MSEVSNIPKYKSQYIIVPIEKNSIVEIIPKKFTETNTQDYGTYSTDDNQFLKGILIENDKKDVGTGKGRLYYYKVKLDNGDIIESNDAESKYYFKLVPNTTLQQNMTNNDMNENRGGTRYQKNKKTKKQKNKKTKRRRNKRTRKH
jgi:hypothetical protein